MSTLLRRTSALSRVGATLRAGAARRMCTAVAEEAPPSVFSPSEPHNAAFYLSIFLTYAFTLRWQSKDRALAKEIAAAKEAYAAAHPSAEVPAEAAPAAAAPVVTSAVVKAVAASAPVGASPADWKVADVGAWLDSIELGSHADSFKTHSVNGKMLLALSDQDLYSTLGVTSPLHRKKLLMEISALRKSYLS